MMDCPYKKDCGGCTGQGISYEEQLKKKQKLIKKMVGTFGKPEPIIGMEDPYYYRNKVHAVFDHTKDGRLICGTYKAGTHKVIPIKECLIEDQISSNIIQTVRSLAEDYKIKSYDEDTGKGFLRHVLVRRGFKTNEIMVVLVCGSFVFPSKQKFIKTLREKCPDITTIVLNKNDKKTTFVLGEEEKVLYGQGYIKDELLGHTFRISSKSFYQVNPIQTDILYKTAIDYAQLTGEEVVLDAYCGTGTIGISLSPYAKQVIGVELNKGAVKDAIANAKENGIKNCRFYQGDAGRFLVEEAKRGAKVDVVIMDPPRSGSDEKFLGSVVKMSPSKVVYVSCGPETLARDLKYLKEHGYVVKKIQPVDMFPFTEHVECVCLLSRK